ncbi:MAG: diaminopropionate ammonia-lyase [Rhodoferax sp.]|nr:diaminopropionate ammonia-lyase [Rhodoferax sp.]HQZ04576.1 diaminopropionate ammonia-lyase [Burkholderiaceae bacterium]
MTAQLISEGSIRAFRNPVRAPACEPYGPVRSLILNDAGFTAAQHEIGQWPGYAPTPLRALPGLARQLGVGAIYFKDEGERFGLKSFKALGGAYAVFRLLAQAVASHEGVQNAPVADILGGRWHHVVRDITVTCATDGNHGRSVAWGAQMLGCRCVIYIHATVSEGRRAAIARYGADVIRVSGNYDDSVRHADAQARENGWTVVSDTTYEGYRVIPIDVMHGYGVMARETVAQLGAKPPTHVFVQAGVGAFAASVAAAFWLAWGEHRPALVVVEPIEADCHLRSAQAGKPIAVAGALDTIMAGLACGEVSPAAWEIVSTATSVFVALDDQHALDAVRALANPPAGDPAIVSGETGGAGLAALLAAREHAELRSLLSLDSGSRVLLLGSEGDTDPEIYQHITGRTAAQVRA